MKKLVKAVLVITGVRAVLNVALNVVRSKEQDIEQLVRDIYEEELTKMNINDVPLVLTNEEKPFLGACKYGVKKHFFTILDVCPAHEIEFSLGAIQNEINNILLTKRAREKAQHVIIRHTVRHELRHAWQCLYKKDVLMGDGCSHVFEGVLDMINGYGQRPSEADANKYAEEYDAGDYNFLLRYCTVSQDLSGKKFVPPDEQKEYATLSKKVLMLNLRLALGLSK